MEQGTIVVLSIIGVLAICVIIYRSNKKSKEELERDERLEDETIQVGERRVTLEQAENEAIPVDDFRIRTVEEIERLYEGNERELELIYRDLNMLNKWANEDEVEAILKQAQQLQEYKEYAIDVVAHYKPNVIMGLIVIPYEYKERSTVKRDTDVQPFYIVKNSRELKRFKTIPEVIVEQIDDNILIRLPKKAKHLMFRHIAMEIDKLLYIDTFRW